MIKKIIAGTVILILVLLVMSGITFLYIILLPPVNNDPNSNCTSIVDTKCINESEDYTAFKNEYLSLPIVARTYLKYVQLLSRYPSIKLMDVLSDHLTLWKSIRIQ